ncbi:zinc finger CCHC-type containing 10 [Aspergillus lucknowensis]|uniref:Zinc knuckle-domain-containing protein n=1 Tax=Aspergillus lucknowensis TaxID=176173 RepID=A0ABR4M6K0_9EURO
MNRYRNAPGVRGPSKATASTLCQKCLKRGHYSYECKVTAQERPYLARPSRTQQLQNPKLRPQLTMDAPDETTRIKGTADALLAQRQEERGRKRDLDDELDPPGGRGQASKRTRSISTASMSSVSTISTNRSRSESPRRERYEDRRAGVRGKSQTSRHSWSRKRRHSDSSSGYSVSSYSSRERSRTRSPERNIRRRRRESSPKERGRARDISRGDDHRYRSRSHNIDRVQTTRARRSISPEEIAPRRGHTRPSHPGAQHTNLYDKRREDPMNHPHPPRRERSLSPYSKRLALTQAMNIGR